MDSRPSPLATQVIQRAHRVAVALQSCQVDTADVRAALLITMDEAFALLDSARNGPWQLGVWTRASDGGAQGRTVRFDLEICPVPGMLWAILFGVALIIENDVIDTCDT